MLLLAAAAPPLAAAPLLLLLLRIAAATNDATASQSISEKASGNASITLLNILCAEIQVEVGLELLA